ncbi:MAG: hypothetical protein LH609_16320 [Rudanella sp.]|nr:hypothetical protein [Rudanella sp.]
MFNVIDFVQEISPVQPGETNDVLMANRQHLSAIASYRNLVANWDEDDAIAPTHQTVVIALDIALLLIATGQAIYHTSPGPTGEIMINLRNGDKSAEFLIYPDDRRKFVCIRPNEHPQQGPLTPDSLQKTLQWLNR